MNDIPSFDDALESFRRFLAEQRHPTEIIWVFREDISKQSPVRLLLRFPSPTKNLVLAKKVFEEGRGKGLVDVHAVATIGDKVAATVWFPKFEGEELQDWDRGMKLSIVEPLPRAELVGWLRWLMFYLKPEFRHYQRFDPWVATKAWAAAQPAFGADSPVSDLWVDRVRSDP